MSDEAVHRFRSVFDCEARAVGDRFRSDMTVTLHQPEHLTWELSADEYGFQGGDGTAPVPMAYFMAGLTSCLLTQLRVFAKKLRIDMRNAEVACHAEWEATARGRDPYVSVPQSVHMDIDFDSDAPLDERQRLIDAAKGACFIEAILREPMNITHRLKTEDGWIDA
jgi:uncharacterized OsmC-like protein